MSKLQITLFCIATLLASAGVAALLLPVALVPADVLTEAASAGRLEAYIQDHSQAEFTHGICPECIEKLYPEIQDKL